MAAPALTAASVSRFIREAGFRPLPSGTSPDREGLRVRQAGRAVGGGVYVTADLDGERAAARLAEDVRAALAARYTVTVLAPNRLHVVRPVPRACCSTPDLFSAYFDADGYAVSVNLGDTAPAGVTWKTVCNACGTFITTPPEED